MDDIFGLVETRLQGSAPAEREHILDVIGQLREQKLFTGIAAFGAFTDAASVSR